jgi:hypothetical protein
VYGAGILYIMRQEYIEVGSVGHLYGCRAMVDIAGVMLSQCDFVESMPQLVLYRQMCQWDEMSRQCAPMCVTADVDSRAYVTPYTDLGMCAVERKLGVQLHLDSALVVASALQEKATVGNLGVIYQEVCKTTQRACVLIPQLMDSLLRISQGYVPHSKWQAHNLPSSVLKVAIAQVQSYAQFCAHLQAGEIQQYRLGYSLLLLQAKHLQHSLQVGSDAYIQLGVAIAQLEERKYSAYYTVLAGLTHAVANQIIVSSAPLILWDNYLRYCAMACV